MFSRKRRRAADAAEQLVAGLARGRGDLDADELALVDRIERRRDELVADDTVVEVVAYGAGSPDATRTAREMEQGFVGRITVAEVCAKAVSKPKKAMSLFTVTRALRPNLVVELGTSVGISGAYIAAALSLDGRGRLVTFEGAPAFADIARETFDRAGVSGYATVVTGRFLDTMQLVTEGSDPIDLAYVDGHRDGDATIDYFERIAAAGRPGTVLVLDDIRWSESMERAWTTIASHPAVTHAIDSDRIGYVVLG